MKYTRAIDLLDSWLENLSDEEIEENAEEVKQVLAAIKLLETAKNED